MKEDIEDYQCAIEALTYTLRNIRDYKNYPTYEFKQQKMQEVNDVINRFRLRIKQLM